MNVLIATNKGKNYLFSLVEKVFKMLAMKFLYRQKMWFAKERKKEDDNRVFLIHYLPQDYIFNLSTSNFAYQLIFYQK